MPRPPYSREEIVEGGHALVQRGAGLFGQHGVVHQHVFLAEQFGPEAQRAVRVLPRALERLRERHAAPPRVHEPVEHAPRGAHCADLHDQIAARGALGAPGHARLVPGHDGRFQIVEDDPVALRPLRFAGHSVDVRATVEHYLDTIFYNLTTVTPKDWRTYEEMRALAQDKYGLSLIDTYLPTGSVEQGIDVLELVDVEVLKAPPLGVGKPTVGSQVVPALVQQVVKIDHPRAAQRGFGHAELRGRKRDVDRRRVVDIGRGGIVAAQRVTDAAGEPALQCVAPSKRRSTARSAPPQS